MKTRGFWSKVLPCVVICSLRLYADGATAQTEDGAIVKNMAESDFKPSPIMPSCFSGALQRIDRNTGSAVFLVKAANSGCTVPSHWHTSAEQITVVSGTVIIKMRNGHDIILKEGGYSYVPGHHVHSFACDGPCVHFVQSDGPYDIHYVDAAGNEISLADAMKQAAPAAER